MKLTKAIALIMTLFMVLSFMSSCDPANTQSDAETSAVSSDSSLAQEGSNAASNGEQTSEASEAGSSVEESSEEESKGPVVLQKEDNVTDEMYERYTAVAQKDSIIAARTVRAVGSNSEYVALNYSPMKAVWISQYSYENIYSRCASKPDSFRDFVKKDVTELKKLGFNTIIIQVRPNADSMYPSAYYPYSKHLLGFNGGFAQYDMLEVFLEVAHEYEMSVHAWFNPIRAMTDIESNLVNECYPMYTWLHTAKYKRYAYEKDNRYYLNISYEAVRQNIINGVAEVARYYNIDGVHFDDYFYNQVDNGYDSVEYAKSKCATLQQYRYQTLNSLIKGVYDAVKAENPTVLFGIAPLGNIATCKTTYFADIDTWCGTPGYIDYICPQIYFGMQHGTCSPTMEYPKWAAACCDSVRLIAGMTWGKARDKSVDTYAGDGAYEWVFETDVIKKSLEYYTSREEFEGYAMYCIEYIINPMTGIRNPAVEVELNNAMPIMQSVEFSILK